MINTDSHFGTLKYSLIIYLYNLVYLCCSLLQQEIGLVLIFHLVIFVQEVNTFLRPVAPPSEKVI